MALMLGKLHEALLAAGVEQTIAREAAEEVAGFDRDLVEVKSVQRLHTWMLGTLLPLNIVITLGVLWKVLTL
jgi:hypothetical protein